MKICSCYIYRFYLADDRIIKFPENTVSSGDIISANAHTTPVAYRLLEILSPSQLQERIPVDIIHAKAVHVFNVYHEILERLNEHRVFELHLVLCAV